MLRVQDIMSRDLFVLDAAASGEEARWALARRRIGGAPVADSDGNVVGVVSKTDLADPSQDEWLAGKEATVEDVMTPSAVVISMEDPIEFAAQQMIAHDIHRIIVVDDVGKPVGIVSAMDIVGAVADKSALLSEEGGSEELENTLP
jgi:predicted transcriptional regulator